MKILLWILSKTKLKAALMAISRITLPAETILDHVIIDLGQSEDNEKLIAYVQEVQNAIRECRYLLEKVLGVLGLEPKGFSTDLDFSKPLLDVALQELKESRQECQHQRYLF